jgi:hypothetical protein
MRFHPSTVPILPFQVNRDRPILRAHIQLAAVFIQRNGAVLCRHGQIALALFQGHRAVHRVNL